MSYIVTTKYLEFGEGFQILGIYESLEKAKIIMEKYLKNASFEIVEIIKFGDSVKEEDLDNIEEFKTKQSDNFIKVNGEEYECQLDYIETKLLGFTTIESVRHGR